ncbi:MAG: HlyD family efflux transporter periplasmic adaptor subunit [Rikenellaceae bacterium]|nr:HlyD family efflux transporter periplasmic adaptor subunit [Rikenellaceae bacterium]
MKRILIAATIAVLFTGCHRNKYDYDASGTFEATEIIVSSEATGRLEWFDIEEGDLLSAGQQVGLVDTVQLHLNKLQLQANRQSVGSRTLDISRQIAATRQQIATQERERERTQRLIAADAANTKQLDDIDSDIEVLKKQLSAQQESIQSSNRSISGEAEGVEAQIASVEDRIFRSRISSPIEGTVLVKYAEQGEYTTTGMPLFKIADIQNMILRAYVTAPQLTQLKIGQQVTVYSDFGDKASRQYTGTITWISDQAEFTPKTIQTKDERANLVYAVKISVPNDGYIKIGMYGDIKFNLQ